MRLTEIELEQLYKLQPMLFLYANQLNGLVKGFSTIDEFLNLIFKIK